MSKRETVAEFELTSADSKTFKNSFGKTITEYFTTFTIDGEKYDFNYEHIYEQKEGLNGEKYTLVGVCNNSKTGDLVRIYENSNEQSGRRNTKVTSTYWGGSFQKIDGKTFQYIKVKQIPSVDLKPAFKFTILQNMELSQNKIVSDPDLDMKFGETQEEYQARVNDLPF